MMMMNGRSNGRFPFTASQWQELEHQALIFKYMAAGHPIPSDLILPIRRSMFLDTTTPQGSFFPHQPNGWGCFQMGFGRKAEDPEPGRCRRTDGKKWRCSKEAHPDSKYCERHMHRGKNRSRKPVEMSLNSSSSSTAAANNTSSSSSSTTTTTTSAYASSLYPPTAPHVPLSMLGSDGYPYSYSRPQFHLDSGSASAEREYRYFQGLKEEVDQYNAPWRFTPLGLGDPKRSFLHQDGYSHLGLDLDKESGGTGAEEKQQHCFVLGADLKMERSGKGGEEEEDSQRTLRHFFDEWPLKSKESWIGLEEEDRFSKTQLSISTPMAHNDHLSLQ